MSEVLYYKLNVFWWIWFTRYHIINIFRSSVRTCRTWSGLKSPCNFFLIYLGSLRARTVHVVVAQWTSKKSTKKRDARTELLFWFLRKQIHNLLLLDLLRQDSYADIDFLINEIKKRMILIQCIATFIFLLLYVFLHSYYYLF